MTADEMLTLIARLRASHALTTAGTWSVVPDGKWHDAIVTDHLPGAHLVLAEVQKQHVGEVAPNGNAAFTAVAHNDAPALLDALEAAPAREERVRAVLTRWRKDMRETVYIFGTGEEHLKAAQELAADVPAALDGGEGT